MLEHLNKLLEIQRIRATWVSQNEQYTRHKATILD